jgi:hypothetical protein
MLSFLLGLGYCILFFVGETGGLVDPLAYVFVSLILIGIFGLYMPFYIEKRLEEELSVGRYFFGCGIGLLIASFLVVFSFQRIAIDGGTNFLTINRFEALTLIPLIIVSFMFAVLSFILGFRFHLLTILNEPLKGSFFRKGELFIAVGMPCFIISATLFATAAIFWTPVAEVLSAVGFISLAVFIVVFIVSACKEVQSTGKP